MEHLRSITAKAVTKATERALEFLELRMARPGKQAFMPYCPPPCSVSVPEPEPEWKLRLRRINERVESRKRAKALGL